MNTRAAFLFLAGLLGCSPTVYTHGIPNLAQVSPGLWRSGQPTTLEQWQYIKSLGVTRVVKLNFESEGSDRDAVAAGLDVFIFSIQPEGDKDVWTNIADTFARPDPAVLSGALAAIAAGGGVLVHCTHGQDRTGIAIGFERRRQGWDKARAYREMLANHFHAELHGLHETWEEHP